MKKAGKIAGRILSILILLFAVFIMVFTIISVTTVNKEEADFLGYRPFIVLSDSMRTEFEVGDMIVSKEVDTDSLREGDIITFRSIDPNNYGGVMTHKIREVTTYEGEKAFITYGTTTEVDDAYPALAENVIGQYVFHLPKMGCFFQFLKSVPGYFILIFTPFMILIILQAVKFFRLLKQYRKEQKEELEKSSAALESERLKTRQMQEELERLRAQISGYADGKTETEVKERKQAAPYADFKEEDKRTVSEEDAVNYGERNESGSGYTEKATTEEISETNEQETPQQRAVKNISSIHEELERLKRQINTEKNDENK